MISINCTAVEIQLNFSWGQSHRYHKYYGLVSYTHKGRKH